MTLVFEVKLGIAKRRGRRPLRKDTVRSIKAFLVFALMAIFCLGCHKISPTKDWQKFHAECLKKHYDEVGPWGGWSYFPLGYHGFAPDVNDATYDKFPRWFSGDAMLFTFQTGWIRALGGVERPANAYVLFSTDGKKMALYHLWGE